MRYLIILVLLLCFCLCHGKDHKKIKEHKKMKQCITCKEKFTQFIKGIRNGESDRILKKNLRFFCTLRSFKTENTCIDFISRIYPTVKYVIENNPAITPEQICQTQLQSKRCELYYFTQRWEVNIHPGGPKKIMAKSYIPKSGKNDLNILQITDIHYDPNYKVGSDAMCKDHVCCRDYNASAPAKNRANRWGNYVNCDTPLETIESTLSHILKTHDKIDLIYVTGDYVDHAEWESSWEHNFLAISTVFRMLTKAFPNIPIYPLLGNHEPSPMDDIAPLEVMVGNMTTLPLYNFLVKEWNWLPDDAKDSIQQGGHYTMLIRPGLRLIALNNIVCMVHNWWLLFNMDYSKRVLTWLENTLYEAEQKGEKVHLLAHIPSGNKHCYMEWAYQFNRIVERYYQTISAQFNGHTHRDEFSIHFGENEPTTPINVAWNGGGISTWRNVNSNYRMYWVEPETFQVVDHETWIFNLTEANANKTNSPKWFAEYRMREAYNIPDLSPASLFNFTKRLATEKATIYKYFRYFMKQGDTGLQMGCNSKCYKGLICGVVSTIFPLNSPLCHELCRILVDTFDGPRKHGKEHKYKKEIGELKRHNKNEKYEMIKEDKKDKRYKKDKRDEKDRRHYKK